MTGTVPYMHHFNDLNELIALSAVVGKHPQIMLLFWPSERRARCARWVRWTGNVVPSPVGFVCCQNEVLTVQMTLKYSWKNDKMRCYASAAVAPDSAPRCRGGRNPPLPADQAYHLIWSFLQLYFRVLWAPDLILTAFVAPTF